MDEKDDDLDFKKVLLNWEKKRERREKSRRKKLNKDLGTGMRGGDDDEDDDAPTKPSRPA